MWLPLATLALIISTSVRAIQPDALLPVEAPIRPIVWGDLNVLHTSDTNGWLGGHIRNPSFTGDWGDYVSLAERFHARADEDGVDLLLVDAGDHMQDTSLYGRSSPNRKTLYDMLSQDSIDITSSGSYEISTKDIPNSELLHMVPNFEGSYISSNIDIYDPSTGKLVPLASRRYRKFVTKNRGYNVLAFGFLHNFSGNSKNTVVTKVQDIVTQKWFRDALKDNSLDIIIVLGHVDVRSPEYDAIYQAVRKVHPTLPLQFFGGYSHVRDFKVFDETSTALQSGRFMETVGWLSVDGLDRPRGRANTESRALSLPQKVTFNRRYIDNNLYSFAFHANTTINNFPTNRGRKTTDLITSTRQEMGLDEVIACLPQDYYLLREPAHSRKSIVRWIQDDVLPLQLSYTPRAMTGHPALALFNTGAIQFDLLKGPYTTDTTYSISSYPSTFNYIPDVPVEVVFRVLAILNRMGKIIGTGMAAPVHAQTPELVRTFEAMIGNDPARLMPPQQLAMMHPDRKRLVTKLTGGQARKSSDQNGQTVFTSDHHSTIENLTGKIIPGYTTIDDAGTDGDDTIHKAVKQFEIPTCMMAEIGVELSRGEPNDLVDLAFVDSLQPFVLLALKFASFPATETSVSTYSDIYFGVHVEAYVRQMWPAVDGKCRST